MAQEIDIGGTRYIASKLAASGTGYTQDYIGQLARGGHIEAKRVSGMWYILEESLANYKAKADLYVPQPPPMPHGKQEADVSVSFDGKDYVSAHRAATLTGYNQDYIGQLARTGQVLSRQVGNRWYVDRESLLSHKAEKERLLAELQSKSVGIVRPNHAATLNPQPAEGITESLTHFSYIQEVSSIPVDTEPTEPEIEEKVEVVEEIPEEKEEIVDEIPEIEPINADRESVVPQDEEVAIPIRVMSTHISREEPETPQGSFVSEETYIDQQTEPENRYVYVIAGVVLVAAIGTILYMVFATSKVAAPGSSLPVQGENTQEVSQDAGKANSTENILGRLFGKELIYDRN